MSTTKMKKSSLKYPAKRRSEMMISQSSRARKTSQRTLGMHTVVQNSRQQAFKDVKAGLTEIKKNLKVNQSMMSNRHKQLQKQKRFLSDTKALLSQLQQDKSYITTKNDYMLDRYKDILETLAKVSKCSQDSRDHIATFDESVSIFRETIECLNVHLKRCSQAFESFKQDYLKYEESYQKFGYSKRLQALRDDVQLAESTIKEANTSKSKRQIECAKYETKCQELQKLNDTKKMQFKSLQSNQCKLEHQIEALNSEKSQGDHKLSILSQKIKKKEEGRQKTAAALAEEIETLIDQCASVMGHSVAEVRNKDHSHVLNSMAECQQMLQEDHLASKVQAGEVKNDQEIVLSMYESEINSDTCKNSGNTENQSNDIDILRGILENLQLTKTSYMEKFETASRANEAMVISCTSMEKKVNKMEENLRRNQDDIISTEKKFSKLQQQSNGTDLEIFEQKVQALNTLGMLREDTRNVSEQVKKDMKIVLFEQLCKLKTLQKQNAKLDSGLMEVKKKFDGLENQIQALQQKNEDVQNKYWWVMKKKLEKEKKDSAAAKSREDHFDHREPKGISESAQDSSGDQGFKACTVLSENPVKDKTRHDSNQVDTIDSVPKRRKFRPRSRSRQKSRRYVYHGIALFLLPRDVPND